MRRRERLREERSESDARGEEREERSESPRKKLRPQTRRKKRAKRGEEELTDRAERARAEPQPAHPLMDSKRTRLLAPLPGYNCS